jgi:hypothetical protein
MILFRLIEYMIFRYDIAVYSSRKNRPYKEIKTKLNIQWTVLTTKIFVKGIFRVILFDLPEFFL